MGKMKYPLEDENALIKLLGACTDDEERGLVLLGFLYGMHPFSICKLSEDNIKKEGNKHYLYWQRPRNKKTLRGRLKKEHLETIRNFITQYRRKHRVQYDRIIKRIGAKAGFENISMMTLRHCHCVYLHTNENVHMWTVHHRMGTTSEVTARNYTHTEGIEDGFRYRTPWEESTSTKAE